MGRNRKQALILKGCIFPQESKRPTPNTCGRRGCQGASSPQPGGPVLRGLPSSRCAGRCQGQILQDSPGVGELARGTWAPGERTTKRASGFTSPSLSPRICEKVGGTAGVWIRGSRAGRRGKAPDRQPAGKVIHRRGGSWCYYHHLKP